MIRKIPLTQGKEALVDECDYAELAKFKWYAHRQGRNYYARRIAWIGKGEKRPVVYMHRAVLGNVAGQVDHVNGDGLDNRRENLRLCSHAENQRNRRKRVDSASMFKGVHLSAKDGRWHVQLKYQGSKLCFGSFDTEEEAARVYDEAAGRLFGEFARLNFPTVASEKDASE